MNLEELHEERTEDGAGASSAKENGTLYAACELMKKQQAQIQGCMVIIELKDLNGADRLKPHSVFSLLQY
ncbi:hypothetical protein ILYODFUR_034289 [Ilyodon furcidens]|uniref:Uncharacterized protein n=1 Tax=Ilyodon furcidens TaxID=33524 RepID=A0ABV0UQ66_9TELE